MNVSNTHIYRLYTVLSESMCCFVCALYCIKKIATHFLYRLSALWELCFYMNVIGMIDSHLRRNRVLKKKKKRLV